MKKILVTGASGFIGSHLVELLLRNGFNVKAFIRYNSRNNWGFIEDINLKNEIEIFTGDIRDYDSVYKALKGCSSVFHLAALIGIPYSYISPKSYIETNINGTYNILQVANQLDMEQILITSTSEVYGTAKYVPIDENHPLNPQSPYSATKIASDQLSMSFYYSFSLPIKIVRPFNNYGPRQSSRAVIPSIITQLLLGKKEIKIGNITPTRDFTFVEDTCNAFLEIYKSEKLFGEIVNVGTGKEISIEKLFYKIISLLKKNKEDFSLLTDMQRVRKYGSEVERLLCDNSKLLKNTNWKQCYNLDDGLKKTIEWISNNITIYKDIYNV
ncbi:MAG: NAD-dependent dehydratase [Candidatus Sericytochromatia bacterium]|nr:MAG: NAD-dependent dehydratase [Candidatus Sericytochromatia bacterium]